MHRVGRVSGSRFNWSSTPRPEWSGRLMSSRMALGWKRSRRREGVWAVRSQCTEIRVPVRGHAIFQRSATSSSTIRIGGCRPERSRSSSIAIALERLGGGAGRGGWGLGDAPGAYAPRCRLGRLRLRPGLLVLCQRRRAGKINVKALPGPGALWTVICRRAFAQDHARSTGPSPVPPNLRWVLPSA